jgi:hypothetical protein
MDETARKKMLGHEFGRVSVVLEDAWESQVRPPKTEIDRGLPGFHNEQGF